MMRARTRIGVLAAWTATAGPSAATRASSERPAGHEACASRVAANTISETAQVIARPHWAIRRAADPGRDDAFVHAWPWSIFTLMLRLLPLRPARRAFLVPGAAEDALDGPVAFVACVLVDAVLVIFGQREGQ